MPKFVNKLDSLKSGPISWEDSERIPLSDIGSLMNKKVLSPEWTSAESPLLRTDLGVRTLTFTAPEDLTIQNLIFDIVVTPVTQTEVGSSQDFSHYVGLSRMRVVSGTGPDVGYDVFEGNSPASMGLFSRINLGMAPRLNIRMAAGDVLEMDVASGLTFGSTPGGSTPGNIPLTMYFTYEEGIDLSLTRKKILGGQSVSSTIFSQNSTAGTAASATITVLTAPATSRIAIQRAFINQGSSIGFLDDPDLLPGTGASGTNTYDNTIATVNGLRDNLVTVINDSANQFDLWTAAPAGAGTLSVTRNDVGASANYEFIDTGGDFSGTQFSGGTSTSVGASAFTPTSNLIIKNIYYNSYSDVNPFGPILSPGQTRWHHGIEITGLEINGSPVSIGRSALPPMNTPIGKKIVNVPVNTGETIEIFGRASVAGESTTIIYVIVADEV